MKIRNLRVLTLLLLSGGFAAAQQGQNVSIFQGVNPSPQTIWMDYASATVQYKCTAASSTTIVSSAVSSATNANPAVFTAPADHGFFAVGWPTRPKVRVLGASGNWAALSASTAEWLLVPLSTTTFSLKNSVTGVDFDGTGLGALTAGSQISSNAPRMTAPVWAIVQITTDVTGKFLSSVMAYSAAGYAANICSNRTSTALEWK